MADEAYMIVDGKTPMMWLKEICIRANAQLEYDADDLRASQLVAKFRVTCTVTGLDGKDVMAVKDAKTKKAAQQLAAEDILIQMGLSPTDLKIISKHTFKDILARIIEKLGQRVINPTEPGADEVSVSAGDFLRGPQVSAPSTSLGSYVEVVSEGPTSTSMGAGSVNVQEVAEISSPTLKGASSPNVDEVSKAPTSDGASSSNVQGMAVAEASSSVGAGSSHVEEVKEVQDAPLDAATEYAKLKPHNYTGELNEFCLKRSIPVPVFKVERSVGPRHKMVVTMSCTVLCGKAESCVVQGTFLGNKRLIRQVLSCRALNQVREDAAKQTLTQENLSRAEADLEQRVAEQYLQLLTERHVSAKCEVFAWRDEQSGDLN